MSIMSQEELDRYELFRRSKLSKAALKRVRGQSVGCGHMVAVLNY